MLNKNRCGSVLILALWTVLFLTVLASNIGFRIRHRAMLLMRIEEKGALHHLAEAGVKKAISFLRKNFEESRLTLNAALKEELYNNPRRFGRTVLGKGSFEVSYQNPGWGNNSENKNYGVVDEERKLNINKAHKSAVRRLLAQLITTDEELIKKMANAINDWKEIGKGEAEGFYSEDYYSNLEFPYEPKKGDFETIDELLLVSGINQEVFDILKSYITIYGDGKININTAYKETLIAAGLDSVLAEKIIDFRAGKDAVEGTSDDNIFLKPFDIASELGALNELTKEEIKTLDRINESGIFKVNSSVYFIESKASLKSGKKQYKISAVYNMSEKRIQYWREK
ncbi:MAG: general secretion pathway protein GspK [Candidatus Omnitrophica bacterium]|nr:general secretion pathway protein GspK [Candidatus Omnitrophota bacterium]